MFVVIYLASLFKSEALERNVTKDAVADLNVQLAQVDKKDRLFRAGILGVNNLC
jgi:hypothetical protein